MEFEGAAKEGQSTQGESMAHSTWTLPPKYRNVINRVTFGSLMVSGFLTLIAMGPLMLVTLVLAIQVLCFSEILTIGYSSNKVPPSLPYFRSLCWYFHVVANYFFSLEIIAPHFEDLYKQYYYFEFLVRYHRFIAFCIYFVGIVLFVLNLVRKYDLKQFKILAWTHTLLIVVVAQSYLVIGNIFAGIIWFILPVSLVILNDIFAYVFGRLYGKTPLIELSPKKTWEGFIGGLIGTFLSGFLLNNFLCKFQYFTCPIEYKMAEDGFRIAKACTPDYIFIPTTYSLGFLSFNYYPFTHHFLAICLFASVIAPFGGFCASGFKRAFKMKDFSDVIPGHGGIMDRFDCQFLMATFVNVYVWTFVRRPSVDLIFGKVMYLDDSSQVQFYHLLRDAVMSNSFGGNLTVV